MKKQMRREFHGYASRELGLKSGAVFFELFHHALAAFGTEDADKNVRALEIGADVHVIDTDERAFKCHFTRNDPAQFPFDDFVDAQHSMFHKPVSSRSKFLGHRLELIALDDVADVIFAEIAELNAAFQAGADFFHIVLKTAER
jgi:hypothetical protein